MFENHSHMSDDNDVKNIPIPTTEPEPPAPKSKPKAESAVAKVPEVSVPVIDEYTAGIDPIRAKRLAARREAALKKGIEEAAKPQSPVKIIYVPGPAVPAHLPCHFGQEGAGITLFPMTPTVVSSKDAEFLKTNFPRRIFLSDPEGKPIPFPVNNEGASK